VFQRRKNDGDAPSGGHTFTSRSRVIDRRNGEVQSAHFSSSTDSSQAVQIRLSHDPERWKPVFRKDHAPPKTDQLIQSEVIAS
jgi:hypothetical protein